MHPFRDDRLAICSFNHSGNSLLIYSCSKTRFFLMFWNMNNNVIEDGLEPPQTPPKGVVLPLDDSIILWDRRDSNPQCRKTDDLQSSEQPLLNDPKVRKGEDGSVDISFYDWHYYDDFKLRMYHLHHQVNIHSFPNQPLYRQINLFIKFNSFIKSLQ